MELRIVNVLPARRVQQLNTKRQHAHHYPIDSVQHVKHVDWKLSPLVGVLVQQTENVTLVLLALRTNTKQQLVHQHSIVNV